MKGSSLHGSSTFLLACFCSAEQSTVCAGQQCKADQNTWHFPVGSFSQYSRGKLLSYFHCEACKEISPYPGEPWLNLLQGGLHLSFRQVGVSSTSVPSLHALPQL